MTGLEMNEPLRGWPPGTRLLCVESNAERMYKAGEIYTVVINYGLIDYKGERIYRNGYSARWEVVEDRPVNLEELM
jgi:hypothetical protein